MFFQIILFFIIGKSARIYGQPESKPYPKEALNLEKISGIWYTTHIWEFTRSTRPFPISFPDCMQENITRSTQPLFGFDVERSIRDGGTFETHYISFYPDNSTRYYSVRVSEHFFWAHTISVENEGDSDGWRLDYIYGSYGFGSPYTYYSVIALHTRSIFEPEKLQKLVEMTDNLIRNTQPPPERVDFSEIEQRNCY